MNQLQPHALFGPPLGSSFLVYYCTGICLSFLCSLFPAAKCFSSACLETRTSTQLSSSPSLHFTALQASATPGLGEPLYLLCYKPFHSTLWCVSFTRQCNLDTAATLDYLSSAYTSASFLSSDRITLPLTSRTADITQPQTQYRVEYRTQPCSKEF